MDYSITIYDFIEMELINFRISPKAYEKIIKDSTPDKLKKMKKINETIIEQFAEAYIQFRKEQQQKGFIYRNYDIHSCYEIALIDEQTKEYTFLKISDKTLNTFQNIIETNALNQEYKNAITDMHKLTGTTDSDFSEFHTLIALSLHQGWNNLKQTIKER